jgi:hypothetical protein
LGTVVVVVLALAALARFVPGSPFAAGASSASAPHATATAGTSKPAPTKAPTPTPSPTPTLAALQFAPNPVTVQTDGFFSWALMDRRTGQIWGSPTIAGTTWPASMIKAWLGSDFLRLATEKKQTPNSASMALLDKMIRDSDNDAAQTIYTRNGGSASIKRLISMCKLTDSKPDSRGWSFTNISAEDTVRMADCIADGVAAGPKWTDWILERMRTVRVGDFGIRKALPAASAAKVSIKNGWLLYDDDHNWHVNCMAVTDTWAMAVLQRFPGKGKYDTEFAHGQQVCKDVATQLINPAFIPTA